MFAGKLIGGLLGFFGGGFLGAIIGVLIGSLFDRAMNRLQDDESPAQLQAIQAVFFRSAFTLIGYLAKADGRVSEDEVQQTQRLMEEMGLTPEHKRDAIKYFKAGSAAGFDPEETLHNFREVCGRRPQLARMILLYLFNTAISDGNFDEAEVAILRQIADGLGFSSFAFEQLLRMVRAQGAFRGGQYQGGAGARSQVDELSAAYAALDVSKADSDAEIKQAYRRLMSENHPDKLIGQGVPADMVKAATERSQEIQAAYDVIKRARKVEAPATSV
ncbi:MAG: co-chaperone DjlA [Gammaproteobacteria bacterium]|uniref:co-chaperone DjlA n=1 Tax=Pseudomaricurvus alcaniphilus TaxID=1166482 RepID=UPI00140A4CC7|nr:co-chaperone DjlA [Pseudomaricurvus alcaniphilus]MBR9909404.1 co-chaperone DjlA [Gammaproteobacteria bacterium]NHN38341.1 co-chaperone DjlA [Pseudomaricurvus alcaniphilus]